MDKETELRKLVDSISPRTAHQYKSYCDKYIRWLKDVSLLNRDDLGEDESLLYKDLPLSGHLVHWFLIDTLITSSTSDADDKDHDNDNDGDFKIPTLKKMISSLKFLGRLCTIHGNKSSLDEKYLESIIKLHSNWSTIRTLKQTTLPIVKVSLNLWNSNTENLSDKYFKTGLEKLRFLVDFHLRVYTNLSYGQRCTIKLAQLQGIADDPGVLCIDQKVWSSLQVYLPNASPQVKSHMPMTIRHQPFPFLCPLTSLASYLYLRFYGINLVTKGDGFPNLLADDADDLPWRELPLIRGKSLLDYPREETLSNYYSTVFRYCHLPYKRREFFNKSNLEFPTWSDQTFKEFFNDHPAASSFAFKYNVPLDFDRIMNFRSPYDSEKQTETSLSRLPDSLLVQLFPEIEQYKRRIDQLSQDAQDFLQLMETLRKRLLLNLPWIHHFFPQHELFKDSIFQNPDFQSYFYQAVGSFLEKEKNDSASALLPFKILPAFEKLTEKDFQDLLMEPLVSLSEKNVTSNKQVTVSAPSIPPDSHDLMSKTFQFVQYQTLTNFQILLSLLSKIFDRLEMKRSSREYMIHQLNLLHDTIRDNINVSKPRDVEDFIKKEEQVEKKDIGSSSKSLKNENRGNGLLAIEDSLEEINDDEEMDGEDGDVMQEELKFMINELVGERVRSTVEQQMEHWEVKIQEMINKTLDDRLKRFSEHEEPDHKRRRLSSTPSLTTNQSVASVPDSTDDNLGTAGFEMDATIDTVEGVILEWFTPNPKMGNQCVHSMNKSHGKEWRTKFEKLYKERKLIVEFYIHLVNQKMINRYRAVEICEHLRKSDDLDGSLSSFAKLLKDWKKHNDNSFDGLLEQNNLDTP